ncbi:hypothetical protein LSCM1_03811 [Leishmania martiniquensis]|uniref:Pseudouridine synthase RsuA/RluA-like domain-containing protein n=1 Tax=Leishmania martiniquensis TaxID=1580590 RepID=A0A836GR25_9TRYP|nr:hypothetical protein LSCM1_03811 [Leishmania martiniquensis]
MPRELRYCRPRHAPEEHLLAYLSKKFTYLGEEEWRQHIVAGHVSVDGETCTNVSYALRQGDELCFAPPPSLEPPVDSERIEVLYEDSTLIVVAKNGSLPVSEGGRYCENTLVGTLRRRGSAAFHTASTLVGSATAPVHKANVSDALTNPARTTEVAAFAEGLAPAGASREAAKLDSSPLSRRRLEAEPHPTAPAIAPPDVQQSPLTLFTVQRLDKETSGAVVLAKNSATAKALASQLEAQTKSCAAAVESRLREHGRAVPFSSDTFDELLQLKAHAVHKTYTAVLRGVAPEGHTFVVVNYMDCMAKHPTHAFEAQHAQLKKLKMCFEPVVVMPSHAAPLTSAPPAQQKPHWGKLAATRIRVLAGSETLGLTCVEVELLTGRSHQIRLHCAAVGYPVLGDKLYTTMTPGSEGGASAVPDAVYLERVRQEGDPFLLIHDNVSGIRGASSRRSVWCRRHLLHATRLTFTHPDASPPRLMTCTVSPVPYFVSDVRWESEADSLLFAEWLSHAVSRPSASETT